MSVVIKSNSRFTPQLNRRATIGAACALAALGMLASVAMAGSREQAKRIHDRLTGTPPSDSLLNQMTALISGGNAVGAARLAVDPANAESKGFYTVTLKNFSIPWTNREQTVFAPLNDYTATVIGMVRDDVPFNTVLSDDILYVGAGSAPAYSPANNDNYQFLEDNDADLRLSAVLARRTQSSLTGIPTEATAGIITTRAAAQAFFIAGTNRAMFRFTLLNHLCHDMEQVQDTSLPPDRIRQDVSRSPGGDSRVFLNNCIGCHSGMDPMAQAFAFYDYDETQARIVYTPGQVQPKYGINMDNFKQGYVTPDDHWDNRWRKGANRILQWSAQLPGSGNGAKSLGQELANSEAFARCQVQKVFKTVCFREPGNAADRQAIDDITTAFKQSNYSLKEVFAQTAVQCRGQ